MRIIFDDGYTISLSNEGYAELRGMDSMEALAKVYYDDTTSIDYDMIVKLELNRVRK